MPIQEQQDEPMAPDTSAAVGSTDHPDVDPAHIPAEVSTRHQPDAGGDKLLAAAQAKAPNLTREFADKHKLSDDDPGRHRPGPAAAAPGPRRCRPIPAPQAAGSRCREA